MSWTKVEISTTSEGIEHVSAMLFNLGMTKQEIEDENDFIEFLEQNKDKWDMVDDELLNSKKGKSVIRIYLENDISSFDALSDIRTSVEKIKNEDANGAYGTLCITTDTVNEEDWANNWKNYFKPIKVGEKILIKPEWETIDDQEGRTVFTINPGMTFGTGTHQSTQLCICAAEKAISGNEKVLDLGCGSGILSIISLLLGASSALAIDIDPNCEKTAYENLSMNNISKDRYKVLCGDILSDESLVNELKKDKYDVVFANIVADVIIKLLPVVPEFLKENGTFICSGIINARLDDVKSAMADFGYDIKDINTLGEWSGIVAKPLVK